MRLSCRTLLPLAVLVAIQACSSPSGVPPSASSPVSVTASSVQASPGSDCVEFVPVQVDIETVLDQISDPQSELVGWRLDTKTYVPQVIEWNLGDRITVFEHCFEVVEVFGTSARLLVNDEGDFFRLTAGGLGPPFLTGASLNELTGPDLTASAAPDMNLPREQRRGYAIYEVTLPDGDVVLQMSAYDGLKDVD